MSTHTTLTEALKQIEALITRPAESYIDPVERHIEFERRLERTRRLAHYLGNPQDSLGIIHIGGTSGKGSIAMLCEAVLLAGGLRVGTHTSPYLQTPLEKVRVGGRLIAAQDAIALTDTVMQAVNQVKHHHPELGDPHYAEAWLGMALRYFADQGCTTAIVEVGMGGRYDSTNIVMPRVSVISTVHYDHVRVLGERLEEIAYHKAGIIKAGVPVVAGEMAEAALRVIEEEAERQNAPLIRVGHEVGYQTLSLSQQGGRFSYRGRHLNLDDVTVGLPGAHQVVNAAAALAALEAYAEQNGFVLEEAAVRRGLAEVQFAGRLEVVQRRPLVVLDGAHNEEKIGALVAALAAFSGYRRLILVLGMLDTKSAEPIMGALAPVIDVLITTAPEVKGKPALMAHELARLAQQAGIGDVRVDGRPLDALEQALALAAPEDLVVVTGSLYLLGSIRLRWQPTELIISQRTMFPNNLQ